MPSTTSGVLIDLGNCGDCGNGGSTTVGYQTSMSSTPTIGDSYTIVATYSDTTTETLTGTVTGVLTASQLVSNLSPDDSTTTTTPTFRWTYPTNASNYTYSFGVWDNNCTSNCSDIWDIPGKGSPVDGFLSTDIPNASTTGVTRGTDPSGLSSNNTPSSSLSPSDTYSWQMQTRDSNSNTPEVQVWFQP